MAALKNYAILLVLLLAAAAETTTAADGGLAPAPGPSSDGVSIDQGIAYLLLFLALAVTYLIHPLDAFPYNLF